jgi:isoleucyl-tRNA synthetase
VIDAHGADALRLYLINSPVVRAEDLCFKEQGVLQNLKSIFLPWYHAYRMLVSSTRLQERQEGTPFVPDLAVALASPNLMDRWILAAANGLVKFMRIEMEAYRLYTVVPRLIDLIEQLTNWYIRMNKERFSGERGTDERNLSLATLFEVMMMLCRMMAPLTPFFAEHVYQNLRRVIPDAPASVHFLMIPEANDAAVDPEMVADVQMMTAFIGTSASLPHIGESCNQGGQSASVPNPSPTPA